MASTRVSQKKEGGCIYNSINIHLSTAQYDKKISAEVWLESDLLKRSRVLSLGNSRAMKESVQTSDPLWETLAAFVYSILRNKIFSC